VTRSFKIKKTLADEFKSACGKKGVGQAAALTKLMQGFTDGTIEPGQTHRHPDGPGVFLYYQKNGTHVFIYEILPATILPGLV